MPQASNCRPDTEAVFKSSRYSLAMFGSLRKASQTEEDDERVDRYIGQLKQFIRTYPIGEKVNYYPEYLEKIDFETLILGYEVNETPIYGRDFVHGLDTDMVSFKTEESGEMVTAAEIASFSVIVPDTSELEKTLDYFSRAEIGKSGQFVRGHSITLVSPATEQGPQVIDTTVVRRSMVKRGYYKGYKVVYLEPQLDTLSSKEHRKHMRMELSLEGTVYSPIKNSSGITCTVIDCSEQYVGLQLSQLLPRQNIQSLTEGKSVRVLLPIPSLNKTFDLKGNICAARVKNNMVVVELQAIRKDNTYKDLELVDKLDLRSSLIQNSNEMRALSAEDVPTPVTPPAEEGKLYNVVLGKKQ